MNFQNNPEPGIYSSSGSYYDYTAPPDWEIQNRGIRPIFFIEPVKDFYNVDDDGQPTSRDVEMVRIVVAGDTLTEACTLVDDKIKERFSREYAAWKLNKEQAVSGTPLEDWAVLNAKQIRQMEAVNIFKVEDLAELTDANLYSISHGRELREKAKIWLRNKAEGDGLMRAAEESAIKDKRIAVLEAQMAKLAKVRKLSPEKRAKISAAVKKSYALKKEMKEKAVA